MLIVRYTGHPAGTCLGCDDPIDLIIGKLYEVKRIKCNGAHKRYELDGIPGQLFMDSWFVRVGESYDRLETEIWAKLLPGVDFQRMC